MDTPKLLMRDMSRRIEPVLDPGGLYPHHNVYWITSEDWDLEVLGGLLLSEVCESFVEAFTVRMRGGTLQFQSQYLRTIAVPDPYTMDPDVAEDLTAAFRKVAKVEYIKSHIIGKFGYQRLLLHTIISYWQR